MSPAAPTSDPNNKPEAVAAGLIGAVTMLVRELITPLNERMTRHEDRAETHRTDCDNRHRGHDKFEGKVLGALLVLSTLGGFLGAFAAKVVFK